MVKQSTAFAWYELLTTDMGAANAFYGSVIGWATQHAATTQFAYDVFTMGEIEVGGLMELPSDARKKGAKPRWVGYVAVPNVDVTVDRLKRLGGAVFVPPTDSNIGRISVVTDPQTATLALVEGLRKGDGCVEPAALGRVGWHELLASESSRAFAFYHELFGWTQVDDEGGGTEAYRLFAAGGQTLGGIFTKLPLVPVPFWLYYFNVGDLGAALEKVKEGRGHLVQGPLEMPDGSWIARCVDPQGAMFALQAQHGKGDIEPAPDPELGWSTAWGGISSKGRLVVRKPKG